MAPPLDVARPRRPPGGLPRLSPRLPAARRRPVPAHARLSARAALRRGPPSLDRAARRTARRPLLPRPLRAARAHQPARARRRHRHRRGAAGARADRGLLLPAGPAVPALDLRRLRGGERGVALRLAAREPLVDGRLSAAARARRRHQRYRRRGDRHDPDAALARHGHRRRRVGRRRRTGYAGRRAAARGARGVARALRAPRRGRAAASASSPTGTSTPSSSMP